MMTIGAKLSFSAAVCNLVLICFILACCDDCVKLLAINNKDLKL